MAPYNPGNTGTGVRANQTVINRTIYAPTWFPTIARPYSSKNATPQRLGTVPGTPFRIDSLKLTLQGDPIRRSLPQSVRTRAGLVQIFRVAVPRAGEDVPRFAHEGERGRRLQHVQGLEKRPVPLEDRSERDRDPVY